MNHNCIGNLRLAFAVFASLAATVTASAQLFNDTNDASTGAWYQRALGTGTPATLTHTTSDATLTGGALSLAYTGATNETANYSSIIGRSFTNTTLGTGDTLRFQFDFHLASGGVTGTNGSILRFGLYDLAGTSNTISAHGFTNYDSATGYYTFLRNGSTTGNGLRFDNSTGAAPTVTPAASNFTSLSTNTTNFTWGTALAYTAIFEVTNNGSDNTVTASVFNSGTTTSPLYSITGISLALSSFDGAFIRLDPQTPVTMNFDNLSVSLFSAIPEPSTYAAWMGLGLLCVAAMRRHRPA